MGQWIARKLPGKSRGQVSRFPGQNIFKFLSACVSIAGCNVSKPSKIRTQEICRIVGGRHSEVGNSFLWLAGIHRQSSTCYGEINVLKKRVRRVIGFESLGEACRRCGILDKCKRHG